ncbi:uncharacterized protein LOC105632094 isoform X2 [Jatropha curcas]|uniref:uncharacterized protein LOC105632094 isoform X2 n=1 Tax=Jatropha curcas TaxID=180498 RepID=UPI0009D759DC|nr:uncharacterized protein LOC105632094 isoform X2 [Jatropha curcas]
MKMNVDDKNIEPLTDLSLALGFSNQCIESILNDDNPGAGANAASSLDMTFVATDPLSELVWSPKKGLSIKCADGSFSNKKASLLLGVGPVNMASGSSSNKPIRSFDKPINKTKFMASLTACDLRSKVTREDDSARFPTSDVGIMPFSGTSHELKAATDDCMEEMKNAVDTFFLHKEDPRDNKGEGETKMDATHKDQTCEEPIQRATYVSDENRALGMEIVFAPESHTMEECEALDAKMKNLTSFGKGHRELEATAENDLEAPLDENACGLKTEFVALQSVNRVKNNSHQDDEFLPTNKTLAIKQSPTNSRIQRDESGKSKALSDGGASERMLNEEDGSHESVESCNTAGLYSTGKRRWNFEQQLIVGSKRVKRQIQESPSSAPPIKQDSSFMNWISNMMKGFSKSSKGDEPSLFHALANSNHGLENPDRDVIACKRNGDPGCRTIGFQSIFQSLYCQKTNVQQAVTLSVDHRTEGSEELELDNKRCNLNATPIACRMVTGNVYKQFLPSNKSYNGISSGNQMSPVVHSKDVYMNFAAIQENSSNNTAENKNPNNLATDKEKDGTSSNSSQGKWKTNSVEKFDSEPPSEGNTACNLGSKGELLKSLWISRFTPKASGPFLNRDLSNKSIVDAPDCSADGLTWKTQLQNPLASSSEYENVEVTEQSAEEPQRVQNYGTASEASFGFYKVKGQHDDKSIYKLNPILLSGSSKNSDAMASVFARRLDALKHITPSDEPDGTAEAIMTCFFCGIKGHNLRECSEVPESDLEDLLRKINSYDTAKELPCLCIRCFQLNHWAVACPNTCSKPSNQAECGTSLVNHCGLSKMQLHVRNEDNIMLKDAAGRALRVCDRNDSGMEKGTNLLWKLNEAAKFGKPKLDVKLFEKEIAPSSVEKRWKGKLMTPLYGFSDDQISDAPKEIFDAIRRLRLSRTDILKWTNSRMPLSNLAGLFLRLRLGKWEEGLGGTGYYVACITGAQMQSSPQKSKKKSITVNVGGIKCLVESQYVSNQDFLEMYLILAGRAHGMVVCYFQEWWQVTI